MTQDNPFPMLGGLTFSEDVFYRILDDLLGVGIVAATDYQVIQNHLGANMSVDVQPGSAYVAFTSVAGGKRRTRLAAQSNSGTPGSPNSADKWLTTFVAADATNPRIDRVVLTVRDTSIDGSGASDSALRVIAGTPTAGATLTNLNGAAAVPANSILLANVLVPSNATTVTTANIDTTVRPQARVAAGAAPSSSVAAILSFAGGTQSFANNNFTATASVLFGAGTEIVNNAGMHSMVTNTDRVTITVAGIYVLVGEVSWAANGTGSRQTSFGGTASLDGNGFGFNVTVNTVLSTTDTNGRGSIVSIRYLAVGDYVTLLAAQGSGAALVLNAARFAVVKIG